MYRYIGNKTKLLPFIINNVFEMIGEYGVVADIMSGTGSVAFELRRKGYKVIASDIMTYSYHHLVTGLTIGNTPSFKGLESIIKLSDCAGSSYEAILDYLNQLDKSEGFFYREFSVDGNPESGDPPRKYFTPENAAQIDAIRDVINDWIDKGRITNQEESLLKHTLIMAVNEVANISGTYGYFLSEYKKNAKDRIKLQPVSFYEENSDGHIVMQGFAEELASDIIADLCYIDPPYMKRQYAANYHILETIARGDCPDAIGKSGLRDWWDQHSKLCTKTRGINSFETIMSRMNCPKFLISYSEDGLFDLEQLEACFRQFGTVKIKTIDYNRFRSNNSKLPTQLKEYLLSVER